MRRRSEAGAHVTQSLTSNFSESIATARPITISPAVLTIPGPAPIGSGRLPFQSLNWLQSGTPIKTTKNYSTNFETQSATYNQSLQQEQIELHKLGETIKSKGGLILDYNTDAINCVIPDNEFPFELVGEIQLNNYRWDNENKEYKYNIEYGKERLKTSRMQETMRTDTFNFYKYCN